MRGFTLIETLVSVFLLTIISLALFNTFKLTEKAIDTLQPNVWDMHELRKALDSLRRDIESSFYTQDSGASRFKVQDRDTLGRQTSSISMTTFAGAGVGHKDVSYYVVEKAEKKLSLYKKIKQPTGNNPGTNPEKAAEVELIGDITAFTVEVFSSDMSAAAPVKSWDTLLTARMPSYVRITITIPAKGNPLTLSETVYPRINARL
ncbi:PulJ/GspJ family protein [Candidatus Magnetominusculus xianensis]|uniref:General secretion pathway protein GspJ n=1 Tax=Candidatus Magnetominusculus xianensis TaxID=1748249 RepID=A0ABR5SIG6_9BACT|nr:prepilin-type N-terminal cleavage/methylation domain-containing protein [Candidatus Magnetominusculus xianensis]KWT92668.1 general secretion pathway protein GspJ [Candidatus Magnetominusculus xianensis]MBF0403781.1 prepilin-type N-terminal cleavage/methylation domain-containing protein [Nitrospirota bacterium]